jgi:hypothetical protein
MIKVEKIAIIDIRKEYNQDLKDLSKEVSILLYCGFGKYTNPEFYLHDLCPSTGKVVDQLYNYMPDKILYCVDDGIDHLLNREQLYEVHLRVFTIAKGLNIPIGLSMDQTVDKALDLFKAAQEIYGVHTD